jgi:actin-like ATPase involved in cell morphogenesis
MDGVVAFTVLVPAFQTPSFVSATVETTVARFQHNGSEAVEKSYKSKIQKYKNTKIQKYKSKIQVKNTSQKYKSKIQVKNTSQKYQSKIQVKKIIQQFNNSTIQQFNNSIRWTCGRNL